MDYLLVLIASDEPDIMMFTAVIPKVLVNPILEKQIRINGYEIFTDFDYIGTNLGYHLIYETLLFMLRRTWMGLWCSG